MPFPCPGCLAAVDASPDSWLIRCPSCGRRLRARAVDTSGETRAYEVELLGRPETRRRIEVPWTASDQRRLARWLFWSTLVTLGLAAVLYVLARAAR